MVQKYKENPHFHLKVLWSGERRFANDGVFNRHKAVYPIMGITGLGKEIRR